MRSIFLEPTGEVHAGDAALGVNRPGDGMGGKEGTSGSVNGETRKLETPHPANT